tara:strand:- start:2035 stop:2955 length:921 start_codon:yes stop_codon:yes gene_type:complete
MKHFDKTIIGSGMSSLIFYLNSKKNLKIITSSNNKTLKSKNFYENDAFGGNSNIWGGYINFDRHKKFLNKTEYKKIFNKRLFKVKKIFNNKSIFSNTYSLVDNKDQIFRVKKDYFKNNILNEFIEKIKIKKKFIQIETQNKSISTNKLILCVGNLNLIKLLYNSHYIKSDDIISFDDGNCSYVLNIFINPQKNYYIPMPIKKIMEKIIFKRSKNYDLLSSSFILQKFSKKINNYEFSCKDLLSVDKFKLRFFLSNHVVNLKINNIPIRKFLSNKSKKIDVFCSGVLKKYLPGPVIQDLVDDIVRKK